MYGAVKWIGAIFLATAMSALLQPHMVSVLRGVGWYDATPSVGEAMNWMEYLIGVEAFPWVAGAMIGFFAGVWLDWVLKIRTKSYPTREAKFRKLGDRSLWVAGRVVASVALNANPNSKFDAFLIPDVQSLKIDFEKSKLVFPRKIEGHQEKITNQFLIMRLRELGTLLRDGHIKEAKREAEKEIVLTK